MTSAELQMEQAPSGGKDEDLPRRSRVRGILCQVSEKPRVTWLNADSNGDYAMAMTFLVGLPTARLPLHDGIELCCNRDALLYGLALARRALAERPTSPPRVLGPDLWPDLWPVSANFLLVRADGVGLVDLTIADLRFWLVWLGLDYILRR